MATLLTKWVDVGVFSYSGINTYGFNASGAYGTVSNTQNGSSNTSLTGLFSGNVTYLAWSSATNQVSFTVDVVRADSGFATMSVGGVSFSRTGTEGNRLLLYFW